MPTFLDRVKFNVSGTPGTGNVTIGSAVSTFQTPAAAGGVTGDILPITFVDGTAWEESYCYFDSAAGTLARTLLRSSTGSLLSLSSSTVCAITLFSRDATTKANSLVYIGQQVLGAAAATITFSNIPADYEDLVLVINGRVTGSNADILVQLNGDTAANYRSETVNAFSTSVSGTQNAAATSMRISTFPGSGVTAGYVGSGEMTIHNYARTTLFKAAMAEWQDSTGTGTFTQGRGMEGHMWASTAAVTSITILTGSGNLDVGTVATLYARAKSNGAGTNDPTLFLIHDQTLASTASSYTVSNIPQGYEDLVIDIEARQNTGAAQYLYVRPNNDSTSGNYISYTENRFGTATATDKAHFGESDASSLAAGAYAVVQGTIFGYSKTSRYKEWLARGSIPSASAEERSSGTWKQNTAVTSLVFFPGANSFDVGTRFRVYGRKPSVAASSFINNNPVSLGKMRPLTDFTQINISGSNTIAEYPDKAISVLTSTLTTTVNLVGVRRAVPAATPFRVAVFVQPNMAPRQYEALQFGFSDGTKYECVTLFPNGGEVDTWSNSTTRVGATAITGMYSHMINTGFWVGIRDDGTNAIYEISADGVNFSTIHRVAKASGYLGSSGYTNVFVGYMPYLSGGTNYEMSLTVREWDENGLNRRF